MISNEPLIGTLNDLIETCKDGEHGFRVCAEQATVPWVKAALATRADACAAAVDRWQAEVVALGGTPADDGSLGAALHRGWVAVRAALAVKDDLAVLEECERGEEAALDRYQAALQKNPPPGPRALIEQEFDAVKRNRNELRAMRDRLKGI